MKRFKKTISFLLLSVYVSALLFQNIAYASPLVEGNEDTRILEFLGLEISDQEVEAGDTVTLSATLAGFDEEILSIQAQYVHTDGRSSFPMTLLNQNDGYFRGSYEVHNNAVAGAYRVSRINIETDQNHYEIHPMGSEWTNFQYDFSSYGFSINGTYGGVNPKVDFQFENRVYQAGESVALKATVDESTLQFNELILHMNSGSRNEAIRMEKVSDGLFEGTFTISPYQTSVEYRVDRVELYGAVYKNIRHSTSQNLGLTQDFSSTVITVEGVEPDNDPPTFESAAISGSLLTPGTTIEFLVNAEDIGSGIKSGYLQYKSENGHLIAVPLNYDGETLKGTVNGQLGLNNGTYRLDNVDVYDHFDNTTRIYDMSSASAMSGMETMDFSHMTFKIEGAIGEYAPVLRIERSTDAASINDKVVIDVYIENAPFEFDEARIAVNRMGEFGGSHTMEYLGDAHYRYEFNVYSSTPNGDYSIYSIDFVKDNHYVSIFNMSSVPPGTTNRMDLSAGNFTVTGTYHGFKPQFDIQSMQNVYGKDDVISIQARVLNFEEQFSDINVQFIRENGSSNQMINVNLSYNAEMNAYTGSRKVSLFFEPGDYEIYSVNYNLKGSYQSLLNVKYHKDYDNSVVFPGTTFSVEGTPGSANLKLNTSINQSEFRSGDQLNLEATSAVPELDLTSATFHFENEQGKIINVYGNMYEGKTVYQKDIHGYIAPGFYQLNSVTIHSYDNMNELYNTSLPRNAQQRGQDFSHLDFTVSGTLEDSKAPELQSIIMVNPVGTMESPIVIKVNAQDDLSGIRDAYASFKNEEGRQIEIHFEVKDNELVSTYHPESWRYSGDYQLDSLHIFDHAENGASYFNSEHYSSEQGNNVRDFSAFGITVQGTLGGFNPRVSINKNQTQYTCGDSLSLELQIEESDIRIDQIIVQYRFEHNDFSEMNVVLNDSGDGVFRGNRPIGLFQKMGAYTISHVALLQDGDYIATISNAKDDNGQWGVSQDLSAGDISIVETLYGVDPIINITSSKSVALAGDSIELTAELIDLPIKPHNIRATLMTTGTEKPWSEEVFFSYDQHQQKFIAIARINNSWKSGHFEILDINIHMDDSWNEIAPSAFKADVFEVQGTLGGYQPIINPTVNITNATIGDDIVITVAVDQDVVNFTEGTLVLGKNRNEVGYFYTQEWIDLIKIEDGLFRTTIPVKEYSSPGVYEISYIRIGSEDFNVEVHDERMDYPVNHKQDFSAFKFEISGTKEDITAPKLISIESDQSELFTGENLNLTFNILEEESGFKDGWIDLVNENGEMLFAQILNIEGKASATVIISSHASPGTYRVRSVNLYDEAGNRQYYVDQDKANEEFGETPFDFSTHQFMVKNRSIEGFSINLSTNSVGPKEMLYYRGNVTNKLEQYTYGYLMYEDVNGEILHHQVNLNEKGDFYGNAYISGNRTAGEYQLKGAVIYSGDNRYHLIHDLERTDEGYADLSSGNYTVHGTIEDFDGPDFRSVILSQSVYGPRDILALTVKADDLGAGLDYGVAYFTHLETGRGIGIHLLKTGVNTLKGTSTISTTEKSGEWVLRDLVLYDEVGNITELYNENTAPIYYGEPADFSAANFTISGTLVDEEGPEYFSSRLKSNTLKSFEMLEIYLETADYLSGVNYSVIEYTYGDGETVVFDGYNDDLNKHIIRGDVSFEEDQTLIAKEIRIYDNEDNETLITSETHDLSHLNVQVTAVKTNDVSRYVEDVFVDGENQFDNGQEIQIYYMPGRELGALKSAKLFFRYGQDEKIFALDTEANEHGYYIASFTPEHEDYKRGTDYEFISLELEMENGEVIALHTPEYPESNNIIRVYANFSIFDNIPAPNLTSFTMENKSIGMDEKIGFELITDINEDINEDMIGYDIHFRVNGKATNEIIEIRDMNKQEFYADRYSLEGDYTVDHITLYIGSDEGYEIFSGAYYPYYEDSFDFGDSMFSVRGTAGDKTAPVINSVQIDASTLEPGSIQHFTVDAEDIGTGVDYGVLYLEDPMGKVSIEEPIYLYLDETDGLLKGTYGISEVSLEGTYKISHVIVFDKALNSVRVSNTDSNVDTFAGVVMRDLSAYNFTIEGALIDHTAPVFRGFVFEEENDILDGIRNIVIDAEDEESGLKNIRLVYTTGGIEKIIDASIFTVEGEHYSKLKFDSAHTEDWKLRRVELIDQIGNKAVIYHSSTTPSSANTMNLSFGDYKPVPPAKAPILERIELDQNEVKPGDQVSISARLNIEGILPEKISATFWSESYQAERQYDLSIQSDGSYKGSFTISEYELDSIWTLKSLTTKDRFDRSYTLTEDGLAADAKAFWQEAFYEVSDSTPDNVSPELTDINLAKVEQTLFRRAMFSMRTLFTSVPESVSFTLGNTIRFTVNAEDEVSGVSRIRLEYKVANQTVVIEKTLEASGNSTYTGEFTISTYHPSGEWRLEKVTLYDEAENTRVIEKNITTGLVPGYGKLNFTVKGTQPDKTPPVIAEISVSGKSVELGERVVYTVNASDVDSGIKEVKLKISAAKMGGTKTLIMKVLENGKFEGELLITPDMPGDIWRVESVTALDNMGNEGKVTNSLMGISTLTTRRDLTSSDVTVKTEQKITVTGTPKTEYLLGEQLSTEGMEVTLTYSDGTTRILDLQSVRTGTLNTTTVGEKEVSILYNALRTAVKVSVREPEVKSISLVTLPKQTYFAGEDFDLLGSEIKISYINGFERVLPLKADQVSGFNKELAGEQSITVSYGGKTTDFTVQVKAIKLESITIDSMPDKLEYIEGQDMVLDGLKITGKNNDGSTKGIDVTMDNITGFNNSEAVSEQIVTIEINGVKAEFSVTIIPKKLEELRIISEPTDLIYVEGDEIDLAGIEVIGSYNDGSEKSLEITKDNVTGFNSTEAEENQIVTVTVDEVSADFKVSIIKKILESIEIKNNPTKTVYIEGQDLVLTGLEVSGTYNNGKTELMDMSSVTVTGYDKNTVKNGQIITVIAGEQSASFTVDVIERVMEKIEITKMPETTAFVVGQTLDLKGLEVTGTFNDESTEILNITMDNLSGFNSEAVEEDQIVTINVDGLKAEFTVDILEKAVVSIEIVKVPSDLEYVVGQNLDLTGLEVKAQYNDNTSKVIEITDEHIEGFDSSKAQAELTVTIKIHGKTAAFSVSIIPKMLESIEITKEPTKTSYFQKERMSLEGLEVYGTYNDGNVEKLTISMAHIEGFSSEKPVESQLVSVKFNGKTASFNVEIKELILESIRVSKEPEDLEYVVGQKLDLTGLEVYGLYNDGREEKLEITIDQVTGYNSSTAQSEQTVTITVEGKTAEFKVSIIEKVMLSIQIKEKPAKLDYIKGQELDLTGLVVDSLYNDGELKTVEVSKISVTGYDKDIIGLDQIITIEVEGKTATFNLSVRENIVEKISILSLPGRVKYFVGEELNLTGLKVHAVYSDGSKTEVSDDVIISGFNSEHAADAQSVVVTYEGKTDTFSVDIYNAASITEEIKKLDETLSKEDLLALEEVLEKLEDTEENREIMKAYETVLQNVMKVEKVAPDTELKNKPGIQITMENLRALNIPEVTDDEVKSVNVILKSEILSKEEAGEYAAKLDEHKNIIALYDMSLIKIVERTDETSKEERIENKDISMITVRIPVPEEYLNDENLVVISIGEDGTVIELETVTMTVDGIRYLYFETDHFSLYGILTTETEVPEDTEEEKEEDQDGTGDDGTDEEVIEEEDPVTQEPEEEIIDEEKNTDDGKEENEKPVEGPGNDQGEDKDLPKLGEENEIIFFGLGVLILSGGLIFIKKRKVKLT